MEKIPKIVRERLKAATPAVNHPDADVLTAFTERLLPELERAIVLEHLARCTDCRDIVALALPQTEAGDSVSPARARWLTWPTLRWGLAAAGIVVLASVGVVQYERASRASTMVAKESRNERLSGYAQPSPPARTAVSAPVREADLDASKSQGKVAPAGVPAKLPEDKLIAGRPAFVTRAPQRQNAFAGASAYGPKMPSQLQRQNTANQLQAYAHVPAPPPGATAKQQSDSLKAPPAAQTLEVPGAETQVETSQAVQSQPSTALFEAAPGPIKAKPALNVIARWSINSAGGLQRSLDQGQTWQSVDVVANAVPPMGLRGLAVLAKDARTDEKVANKKSPSAPLSSPVFRAVAANGPDVWAGGTNRSLFHSLDAGNHWILVLPSAAGVMLTGDVVRLDFSDAQHGTVITSTAEIWITSDDGQTWQKP